MRCRTRAPMRQTLRLHGVNAEPDQIRVAARPKVITRAEFEAIWDGRLISAGSQSVAHRVLHALAGMSVRGRALARRARDALMRARFADRCDIAVQAAGA